MNDSRSIILSGFKHFYCPDCQVHQLVASDALEYRCSETGKPYRGPPVGPAVCLADWRDTREICFLLRVAAHLYPGGKLRRFASACSKLAAPLISNNVTRPDWQRCVEIWKRCDAIADADGA